MAEPRTLVLTRPEAQGRDIASALEARRPGRFRFLYAPLLQILPLKGPVNLSGIGGLAFSSANGVHAFAAASAERGFPAWCVGDVTAGAAAAAGFAAVASANGDVRSLAGLIADRHPRESGAILHVRGRHAAGDLVYALARCGVATRAAELYDQRALPLGEAAWAALTAGAAITAFSPRTARLLAAEAAAGGRALGRATAVSLSAAADAALADAGFGRRLVAAHPGRAAMLEVLASLE